MMPNVVRGAVPMSQGGIAEAQEVPYGEGD